MQAGVLSSRKDHKIVRGVVRGVTVQVMHNLIKANGAAELPFGHQNMLQYPVRVGARVVGAPSQVISGAVQREFCGLGGGSKLTPLRFRLAGYGAKAPLVMKCSPEDNLKLFATDLAATADTFAGAAMTIIASLALAIRAPAFRTMARHVTPPRKSGHSIC